MVEWLRRSRSFGDSRKKANKKKVRDVASEVHSLPTSGCVLGLPKFPALVFHFWVDSVWGPRGRKVNPVFIHPLSNTALNLYSFHASFFFFACEYRAKPPNTKIKHSKGQDEGEKRRSQRIIEQLYRRRRWPSSRSSPTLPLSPP